MHRDTKEALERLEAQLLEEETPVFQPEDEEPGEDPAVYKNYANDYGKQLRNYASGYKAYNTDTVDEDLDAFSQAVWQGPKKRWGLRILGFLLLGCILAAAIYTILHLGVF